MKILLTMNVPFYPAFGGAQKANRHILDALVERGHRTEVIAPALGTPSSIDLPELTRRLRAHGTEVNDTAEALTFRLGKIGVEAVKEQALLRNRLVEAIEREDPDAILVSTEDPSHKLLEAALSARPDKIALLVHTPAFLPFGPQAFFPSASRTELLRRVPAVVAVSEYAAAYVREWGKRDCSVMYVPGYGRGPFENLARFDAGRVTMINPCRVKGIDIFLALAERLPEVGFAAVPTWGTTEADRAALARFANIEVWPPADDFEDVLRRTRVMLVPSLWNENFPLVVLETMLRGIPVITSDVGGLRETKCGTDFVCPVRPIASFNAELDGNHLPTATVETQVFLTPWTNALEQLLGSRAVYEAHSAASRAASRFVGGLSVEPLEKVLRELAARRSPSVAPLPPDANPSSSSVAKLSRAQLAQVALRLQRPCAANANGEQTPRCIITLRRATQGVPLFLVPPIGGESHCYVDLARGLGERPVFGFTAHDGGDPLTTVEGLAERYVTGMRKIQRDGRYSLAGWSFGGLVAYEMARIMEQAGHEVRLLAMIDTALQPEAEDEDGLAGATFFLHVLRELPSLAAIDPSSLQIDRTDLEGLTPWEQVVKCFEALKRAGRQPSGLGFPELEARLRIYLAHREAMTRFVPKPCRTALMRLTTSPSSPEDRERERHAAQIWGAVGGAGVETLTAPGDHFSVIRPPHVNAVARLLEERLS